MDFEKFVKSDVTNLNHQQTALSWWSSITLTLSKRGRNIARNINNDVLFETTIDRPRHMNGFASGLLAASGSLNPMEQVKTTINDSDCMICCGPPAGTLVDELWRLLTVQTAFNHLASATGTPKTMGMVDPTLLKAWARDLDDPNIYHRKLDGTKLIRGQLRNAFWAPAEDIKKLGSSLNVERARKYVGWGPVPNDTPHIFLRLLSTEVSEKHVPTGWDAFDNEYFLAPRLGDDFGHTQDLETGGHGSREVVTREIPVARTICAEVI